MFSIGAIQEEEGWERDSDFLEAVNEDFQHIIRFSEEMKEGVIELASTNYKPENDKIEQLVDANRITERENQVQANLRSFREGPGKSLERADA
jgi:hypothetical protein